MMERKSSDVLLAKGRQVDELRRPENSPNPFPLACYARKCSNVYQIQKIKEEWKGKRMVFSNGGT